MSEIRPLPSTSNLQLYLLPISPSAIPTYPHSLHPKLINTHKLRPPRIIQLTNSPTNLISQRTPDKDPLQALSVHKTGALEPPNSWCFAEEVGEAEAGVVLEGAGEGEDSSGGFVVEGHFEGAELAAGGGVLVFAEGGYGRGVF